VPLAVGQTLPFISMRLPTRRSTGKVSRSASRIKQANVVRFK